MKKGDCKSKRNTQKGVRKIVSMCWKHCSEVNWDKGCSRNTIPFSMGHRPENCSILDWSLNQIPRKTLAILYRNFWKNARREWWKSKKVFFLGGGSPN